MIANRSQIPPKAFSLIEVLLVISLIAITATLGVVAFGSITQASKVEKLKNEVRVFNSAIACYHSLGGELTGSMELDEVISSLKKISSKSTAGQFVGLTGNFLDPRVTPVFQTAKEAVSNMPRAYWDKAEGKLVLATSGGVPGIREFRLNDQMKDSAYDSENRYSILSYSSESTWIWDYKDLLAGAPLSPTGVTLTSVVHSPVSSLPVGTPEPQVTVPIGKLESPLFSIPGGNYPMSEFDLSLEINDPNPSGRSNLYVSVDYGEWTPLASGTLTVSPGQTVRAQAVSADTSLWYSSEVTEDMWDGDPADSDNPFSIFCGSDLSSYGVTILDGGVFKMSHSYSGVEGDVAIAPGGTWSMSDGAVTGSFFVDPGVAGNFGNADDEFGDGGSDINPVSRDLTDLKQTALFMSSKASSLDPTETFDKISSGSTITATATDGLNVIQVNEIALSGGAVLTLSGGADDYFVINISNKVKMSGGSTWELAGVDPSHVMFNMQPGSTEFSGTGGSAFNTGGIILAPHPEAKVTLTGESIIIANVITSGEFSETGGSQLLGGSCK